MTTNNSATRPRRRGHLFHTAVIVASITLVVNALTGIAPAHAYPAIHMTDLVNVRVAPNLSGAIVGYQANNTTPKRVRCVAAGQQIADTNVWFFIDSDAVSDFGGGWLTAYYTDANYNTFQDLQDSYGVPRCDRNVASFNGSVYFQPRYSPGDPTVPYTTFTATKDLWAVGNCSADSAAYWSANFDGEGITRASGWSLGRLGITYLMAKYPARAARLNTIILFDPGSLGDYLSDCDQAYDQDGLMANWLAGNSSRQLLVLAGQVTRDADHPDAAGRLHQGIQQYLFPAIRSAGRSNQVLVCNYDTMAHSDVLANFSSLAKSGSTTLCPGKPDASWHP